MTTFDELLRQARTLSPAEKQRLARELTAGAPGQIGLTTLPAAVPAPHSVAWLKAERGHAVLATDTGPAEDEIPAGWEAIAGMWANSQESTEGGGA